MAKKYLCAVDGTKVADRAAACAVDMARNTGAKLTFLNVKVVPTRTARRYYWDAILVHPSGLAAHKALQLAARVAKAAKFGEFETVFVSGSNVADAIVAYARKNKTDHVVLGTEVTNELARIFVGSVATAVVSHSDCPVTVVK